ncbi:hypothetical protein SAICODRAFT_58673, partial [Saitoella complicata NRRL Y-17804]|uniref:uncharacterized protein n=1 Tax=Saitoella complicata (strain BCRC 22490 / CBS 7301 / JCM 7358 / NBRC 10748 / NRRL Y-17804) TaxID=698492 RepID=UPI000867F213
LPQSWNSTTPSLHEFRYTHTQSSLTFLIKLSRLGPKVMIYGMGLGDDKPATYSVIAKEYTSENFFPYPSDSSEEPLQNGYVSSSRLKDFAGLFKLNVLQKIIPGLHKAGYEEASSDLQEPRSSASTSEIAEPLRPLPYGDPGFDPLRPAHLRPGPFGGINPFSIGHDDLNPPGLGSNPSLTGPFFGGGNSPLPRPGMGGMHPTADHPLFGGRGGDYGDERPPNAPPGARWDPVGPGNGGFGLPRGPRGPFGGNGSGFPGGGFL